MNNQITISAKNLGSLAMPDFCPRCFWIKQQVRNKLPFQIFPGIFSSIDAYTKRVIHSWFDQKKNQPPWLKKLGEFKGYIDPPHYTRYHTLIEKYNIVLRGSPDGILVRKDGSYFIIDYKTAKFTPGQDELFPMYDAQLNSYALIGERLDLNPVSGLALIYTEPVTDDKSAASDEIRKDYGFSMRFSAHIENVEKDASRLYPLMKKVREINDLPIPPEGITGCKDCEKLENLISIIE